LTEVTKQNKCEICGKKEESVGKRNWGPHTCASCRVTASGLIKKLCYNGTDQNKQKWCLWLSGKPILTDGYDVLYKIFCDAEEPDHFDDPACHVDDVVIHAVSSLMDPPT